MVLIGNVIESMFMTAGNWNLGSAISLVLAIIIMLSMWLTKHVDKDLLREGDCKMTKKKMRLGSKIFLGLLMLFFYLPIIYTVIMSFNSTEITDPFQRFFAAVV